MQERLVNGLMLHKKQSITKDELEALAGREYAGDPAFTEAVHALEEAGYLSMVKKSGRTVNPPHLAYKYRLNRAVIHRRYHRQLHRSSLELTSGQVSLDAYFNLSPAEFDEDWPWIKQIDAWVTAEGLPDDEVTAEERSVMLVNDEKWITAGKGKTVLTRIGLWDRIGIMPISEPLMLAVHPQLIAGDRHLHLIVENKTTWQALVQVLPELPFTSVIFGSGWRITGSLEQLDRQVPVKGARTLLYFGDLDHEGLAIWHDLHERYEVKPAVPFYEACLARTANRGKTNQRKRPEALEAFLPYLDEAGQAGIQKMLDEGRYLPQEVLTTDELQRIGRVAYGRL